MGAGPVCPLSSQGPAVNYVIIIIIVSMVGDQMRTIKTNNGNNGTYFLEGRRWGSLLFYLCWHWTPLYRRSFLNPNNTHLMAVMIIFILRRLVGAVEASL